MVRYGLARRRVEVGERPVQHVPRPVIVRGEQSALSTLILAQMIPQLAGSGGAPDGLTDGAGETVRRTAREFVDGEEG